MQARAAVLRAVLHQAAVRRAVLHQAAVRQAVLRRAAVHHLQAVTLMYHCSGEKAQQVPGDRRPLP